MRQVIEELYPMNMLTAFSNIQMVLWLAPQRVTIEAHTPPMLIGSVLELVYRPQQAALLAGLHDYSKL
ncbi:hypothetical protein JCM19231_2597 [Vibrio ishigakensis]|uniref:Uncharacterized protein n=1 Tax=Vibrio ishigakensis TaxID=1481914 RepID=A0A0B8NRB6_9VIBR|nr:hypothetical protein JCM19231_2597 [Vibrio ishigakensis]